MRAIFANPVRSNINWDDIEKLLISLGAQLSEARGSRLKIILNGVKAVVHRPHPRKETEKWVVVAMRRFLLEAGVQKHEI